MFKVHQTRITTRPLLNEPLENLDTLLTTNLKDFDHNNFELSELEKLYFKRNEVDLESTDYLYTQLNMFNRWPPKQKWFYLETPHPNLFVNGSYMYTRYGFAGRARYELDKIQEWKPEVSRLISIKPKWGLYLSLDWNEPGNSFEILHIDKHYTDTHELEYEKILIQDILFSIKKDLEFRHIAGQAHIWKTLNFEEQNTYKKEYFGIDV